MLSLQRDALVQPLAWRSPRSCGKSQGLSLSVVVAEVLLQRQLGQQEGDLVAGRRRLQVVEGVDARSRRRSARSRSWSACRSVDRASCRVVGELARQPLARAVVAVAEQAGEGDLAVDALSRARTRVGIGPGLGSVLEPRAGDEGERHAVDLGVLGLEHARHRSAA